MGVKGAPENINLLRSSSQVKKNVPLRLTGAASGIHRYEYARIASGVPTCGAITISTHLFFKKKHAVSQNKNGNMYFQRS